MAAFSSGKFDGVPASLLLKEKYFAMCFLLQVSHSSQLRLNICKTNCVFSFPIVVRDFFFAIYLLMVP